MKPIVLTLVFCLAGSTNAALAGGSAQEQDSCRNDVHRYCRSVPADAGDFAFLKCLQAQRAKLSRKCQKVLEDNGV